MNRRVFRRALVYPLAALVLSVSPGSQDGTPSTHAPAGRGAQRSQEVLGGTGSGPPALGAGCLNASSVVRNGSGVNPLGFSELTPPVIGTVWRTSVDIATPGASVSLLVIGIGPITAPSSMGELLVAPLLLGKPDVATGSHAIAIPSDLSLLGRTLYAQAATLTPPEALALTNAIDITLGTQTASIGFEEVTGPAGLDTFSASWSVSWGDANGDGFEDLWSGNHGSPPDLYLSQGDGTFVRATNEQMNPSPGDSHGASWADFDGDGDQDLLELVGAGRGTSGADHHLYINKGTSFVERSTPWGLALPLDRGRNATWLDWNEDGHLDLMVLNAKRKIAPSRILLQEDGRFVELAGAPLLPIGSLRFAQVVGLFGPDTRHVIVYDYYPPRLVLDLRADPPVDILPSLGLPTNYPAHDAAIADFDGDLLPDIYIARVATPSDVVRRADNDLLVKLVRSNGLRTFEFECSGSLTIDVGLTGERWWSPERIWIGDEARHPATIPFTLSAGDATGTWDPTDLPTSEKAIFVLYEPGSSSSGEGGTWTISMQAVGYEQATLQIAGNAPITNVAPEDFTIGGAPHPDRLFFNDGRQLVDRWETSGFPSETFAMGVVAGDFDNDMDVDLYLLETASIDNRPNSLFANRGDGTFVPVPGCGGAEGTLGGTGDAVAIADYDRDGFLDIATTNGRALGTTGHGPLQLFRNKGNANHWLQLELRGTHSNPEAIGAQVVVTTRGHSQVRYLGVQTHRGAQNTRRLHFGLGPHLIADRVEIFWPRGHSQVLRDVPANQILRILEPAPGTGKDRDQHAPQATR